MIDNLYRHPETNQEVFWTAYANGWPEVFARSKEGRYTQLNLERLRLTNVQADEGLGELLEVLGYVKVEADPPARVYATGGLIPGPHLHQRSAFPEVGVPTMVKGVRKVTQADLDSDNVLRTRAATQALVVDDEEEF